RQPYQVRIHSIGKYLYLLRCRVEREPERRMAHEVQSLSRRRTLCEHVFTSLIGSRIPRAFRFLNVVLILLMADWTLMTELVDWH
ncbi:MAG: hypothetical protein ACJ75E_18720, partial [Actinomycetes bacterium]